MANVNDNNINPKLVKIPKGYSNYPAVGKIQQLYALNNENLYKRLTPYTQNSSGLFSFGPRQPFVYVSPNKGRKGINGLKRFESRIFPIGSGLQDVQRIAKFLVTGKGILFLTKQFLLQRTQPFNETRIYNPLGVINAVVRPVTGFILPPPTRHLSGGLLGALASLIGINASSDKPIKGTVAEKRDDVLKKFEQTVHANRYGKGFTGLIRGGTAASAYYGKTPSGASGGLINFAKKLFGFGGTVGQPSGTQFRADEKYSIFDLKNGSQQEFGSYSKDGVLNNLHQRWYNDRGPSGKPDDIIDDPGNEHKLKLPGSMKFRTDLFQARAWATLGGPAPRSAPRPPGDQFVINHEDHLDGQEIGGKIKAKYGDTVFSNGPSPYASSDIILIYKNYISNKSAFIADKYGGVLYNKIPRDINPSGGKGGTIILNPNGTYSGSKILIDVVSVKGNYSHKIDSLNRERTGSAAVTPLTEKRKELEKDSYNEATYNKLQSILQEDGRYGESSTYGIYSTGKYVSDVNLNYLELMRRRKSPLNQETLPKDGYQARLNNNGIGSLEDYPKGFSGTRRSDYVNTLRVLDKSSIDGLAGEGDGRYHPYRDDQIAFYFHDLVNDKYIPFRCTVSGISDTNNAKWGEINYIGRSDRTFNYTGFSRNISFKFKVAAMSIAELLPMWSRINYLIGLTRPSNYKNNTTKIETINYNSSFVIPPLVTFTIGDLYKEQPIILENVSIVIPEDSIWETLPEKSNDDWSYLGGKIVWKDSIGKFAQFPLECEISIGGQLLERETPMTGKNNFADVADFESDSSVFSNNMGFDNRNKALPESEQVKRIMNIGGRQANDDFETRRKAGEDKQNDIEFGTRIFEK